MVKITDIKLIEKKEEIETYEGNMKIKFKKIKMKNENEYYLYKSFLLNNNKIYDIIKDNNIIYIYYNINENIDELINIKDEKECVVKGHTEPINKREIEELFKKEDAMCKIESKKLINGKLEDIIGSGFFLKINMKDILFKKCLLTNNHILDENDIKVNKEIIIEYKNEIKSIEITENRKVYTNKELDYTCIEIFDKDNIKEYFTIDEDLIEYTIEIYKNKEIFILQYPLGDELSFSSGIILDIKGNKIIHNSSTYEGSSGSPIILRNSDNSIIGLHNGSYKDNNQNYIISEIKIKEEDANKEFQIINSYEQVKRIKDLEDEKDDYENRNEKEIKENCEIKINNNIIPFSYYYEFKKKGKYKIEYSFKNKLTKTCCLFRDCSFLVKIDLSNFNTQNVTDMWGMFYNCSSLTNIDLSNFNTQNVNDMGNMFYNCSSLTKINLSNFNTQNVIDMSSMFYNCSSLTNIDLSNFNTQNITFVWDMFYGCKSLNERNIITKDINILKELSKYLKYKINY